MNRRGYLSIAGVAATAIISGFLLWRILASSVDSGHYGLMGVFATSMLSHLTVVARDMFIPLFLPLTSTYHPLILGISAGVGGAIGEVATYILGYGVAETVEGERSTTEDRVASWIKRYGLWAVLLVSLTPLPDTPIVILAGSRRLPFLKLLGVEILGKVTLYSLGAFIGGVVFLGLENSLGSIMASTLMVIASIVFTVFVTWRPSRNWIFGFVEKIIE
jgi:membrane protein YqaA with SNARE-associated domain